MFHIKHESFAEREKRILEFWDKQEVFAQSLKTREKAPVFSFYDGPPFATGLPHYGHLLAGTIKDVIPRYKTMKGYYVPRRFGWDCHGLPVENEIEKAKNLAGAPSIEKFGIAQFNEECRSIVQRYTEQWKGTVARMGRWVDFDNSYKTMDSSFMESVWWIFGKLWDMGLVYQGFKVMPFSAKLGTPLSNFEANLNYKDVDDPSLTIKLELQKEPGTYLLIWTTTPWTLPSNLVVMVHPDITYVKIQDLKTREKYLISKSRISAYYAEGEYQALATLRGKDLIGLKYTPLFSYYVDHKSPKAFTVIADEGVGEEDGTGIVHGAPAFGEMDFFACSREGIEPVCPVDQNGRFTQEIPEYTGLFVKDADKEIIRHLKQANKVLKHTQIRHRYPFCYRSDTPLIYKAVTTWFVAVEKIKEKVLKANSQIYWMPAHIKEGRFGKWLENARDWAVSRNRYWGTPIPLWKSEDGEYVVVRSIEELEKKTGTVVRDLHRHFIDTLTLKENGKVFKRIPEVFDCWFETGTVPYSQYHYPFENKEKTLKMFPADFIAEGLDQTRGWFYTLVVLGAALFDKPAFTHAVVNGIVLAEDGQKMSKSLKNYPDPMMVIENYGADAIRLYLLHSPVVQADDLRFSERDVEVTLRQFILPLWNSYLFLSTYAQIYEWKPTSKTSKSKVAEIDRWILSLSQKLIFQVEEALDRYDLMKAIDPLIEGIEQMTNWYIRRCRSRFWSEEESEDRREAFETLYQALLTLVKVAAPFIPFLTEAIYQEIKAPKDPLSVHLCDYPKYEESLRDQELEYEMVLVQQAVGMGHSLRKEHKIKVRQPLAVAHLITANTKALGALKTKKNLIEEELNVKEVIFSEDESAFVRLSVIPNYRILGKKVGKLMNQVKTAVEKLDTRALDRLQTQGSLILQVEGEEVELTPEDVQIKREVLGGQVAMTQGELTITLDTMLNEALILEGFAREMINKINTMRKTNGFEITDRIHVKMQTTDQVKKAFGCHKDYICHEVLATSVTFDTTCDGCEVELNGEPTVITLQKA